MLQKIQNYQQQKKKEKKKKKTSDQVKQSFSLIVQMSYELGSYSSERPVDKEHQVTQARRPPMVMYVTCQ